MLVINPKKNADFFPQNHPYPPPFFFLRRKNFWTETSPSQRDTSSNSPWGLQIEFNVNRLRRRLFTAGAHGRILITRSSNWAGTSFFFTSNPPKLKVRNLSVSPHTLAFCPPHPTHLFQVLRDRWRVAGWKGGWLQVKR